LGSGDINIILCITKRVCVVWCGLKAGPTILLFLAISAYIRGRFSTVLPSCLGLW